MSDYQTRKEQRRKAYGENHGRKLIPCTACSGSGFYDSHGSPKCGSCEGTGKEREPLPRPPVQEPHWRDVLAQKNALTAARRRS